MGFVTGESVMEVTAEVKPATNPVPGDTAGKNTVGYTAGKNTVPDGTAFTEPVDLYDENRLPLGYTGERFAPRKKGEYRLVVHICIFDTAGRMLIQHRKEGKRIWPGRWDVSAGGGVDVGETSRQAAERECKEELGLSLNLSGVRPTVTVNFSGGFDDYYLLCRDVPLSALTLQKEEVSAVRYASLEEILSMVDAQTFIPYPKGFLQYLFEARNLFGFPHAPEVSQNPVQPLQKSFSPAQPLQKSFSQPQISQTQNTVPQTD